MQMINSGLGASAVYRRDVHVKSQLYPLGNSSNQLRIQMLTVDHGMLNTHNLAISCVTIRLLKK
jgi:hypothetical protein